MIKNKPETIDKVAAWALIHASEDYHYGTRQSYFNKALSCALISQKQYDEAREWYGRLWDYRGD